MVWPGLESLLRVSHPFLGEAQACTNFCRLCRKYRPTYFWHVAEERRVDAVGPTRVAASAAERLSKREAGAGSCCSRLLSCPQEGQHGPTHGSPHMAGQIEMTYPCVRRADEPRSNHRVAILASRMRGLFFARTRLLPPAAHSLQAARRSIPPMRRCAPWRSPAGSAAGLPN